jgi:hypothetical protein
MYFMYFVVPSHQLPGTLHLVAPLVVDLLLARL